MQRGNHMRKLSFLAVAVLILVGVGTWIGVGARAHTALAASSVDPSAMMTSAKDLPTSHYVDYSVVFTD